MTNELKHHSKTYRRLQYPEEIDGRRQLQNRGKQEAQGDGTDIFRHGPFAQRVGAAGEHVQDLLDFFSIVYHTN